MVIWKALTAFELLYLVITFSGFVAVVVSLRILTRQAELLATTAKLATYASIANTPSTNKQIFIEHPDLRPYFYDKLEMAKNDPRYSQAQAVAEHLLDFFDGILLLENTAHWDKKFWEEYIADCFRLSKILQHRLEDTKEWYTPALTEFMKGALGDA